MGDVEILSHNGWDMYHIEYPLSPITIETLKDLGYTVESAKPASIQADGIHHTIRW